MRPCTALAEAGARRERQYDPRETSLEIGHRHPPAAGGRIVQARALGIDAFQDDKMIELPEQDLRRRQGGERLRFLPVTARHQPVISRCPQDIGRLAAVARYAAEMPKRLQLHETAEMANDHCQRGRTAFGRLHLQHRGRAYEPGPHGTPETSRCSAGKTSSASRTSRICTAPSASVPAPSVPPGPCEDDHR